MKLFKTIVNPQPSKVGHLSVNRIMPQNQLTPVGAWVFLDHYDQTIPADQLNKPDGSHAHPHRGIATLSYLFHGEVTHLDSRGQQGHVSSGGAQWMKAGNGIVHDEWFKTVGQRIAGVQFWINLSAKGKTEAPAYLSAHDDQLGRTAIGDNGSYLKVVVGEYQQLRSPIPSESRQLLLHVHLAAGESIDVTLNDDDEYAAFVAKGKASFNEETLTERQQGYLNTGVKHAHIHSEQGSDILVYGGQAYQEPIASGGPFVMNSQAEIMQAYQDYQDGRYGEVDYDLVA